MVSILNMYIDNALKNMTVFVNEKSFSISIQILAFGSDTKT
jgi:hypothetical protein